MFEEQKKTEEMAPQESIVLSLFSQEITPNPCGYCSQTVTEYALNRRLVEEEHACHVGRVKGKENVSLNMMLITDASSGMGTVSFVSKHRLTRCLSGKKTKDNSENYHK